MHGKIVLLYKLPQTIFRTQEIAWLWRERNRSRLHSCLRYGVKNGLLVRLTRGIFSKSKRNGLARYDPLELASKLYIPSYVSFETVLSSARILSSSGGNTLFVAAGYSKTKYVDGWKFVFRKLKKSALYNQSGIVMKNNRAIAGSERAFLDMLYLFDNYYFDNLASLNWKKCFQLLPIYKNKALVRRFKRYYRVYGEPPRMVYVKRFKKSFTVE